MSHTPPQHRAAHTVFILGLDGATWDLLNPAIRQGLLPRLGQLVQEGTQGQLASTVPPITPAAWTTFLTGQSPGRHGIVDFVRYDPAARRLQLNNSRQIRVPSLWQIASDAGLGVVSLLVPMCYPPYQVRGVMVSGLGTPGTHVPFVYPPEAQADLLKALPDFQIHHAWHRSRYGTDDATFTANMHHAAGSFTQTAELLEWATRKTSWRLGMAVLKLVDDVSHKAWPELSALAQGPPGDQALSPARRQACIHFWQTLDHAIGRMIDHVRDLDPAAAVFIMSDHGHGELRRKVYVNALLEQGGFLRQQNRLARAWAHTRDQLSRWTLRKGRFNRGSPTFARDIALNWPASKAACLHAEIDACIYINLRGREGPDAGCVDPQDYEPTRDAVRRFLLEARDDRGEPLFSEVHRAEVLYGCPLHTPGIPDLLACPPPGSVAVRKLRGGRTVRHGDAHRFGGTHRREGVFVAHGPAFRAAGRLDARMIDLPPTILGLMGIPIPAAMQGDFLSDCLLQPYMPDRQPADASPGAQPPQAAAGSNQQAYTPEEEAEIARRLEDLGYLE